MHPHPTHIQAYLFNDILWITKLMLQIASEFVQHKLYQHTKFLSSQLYLIFPLSLTGETPLKASNFIKIINQSNWNINIEIVGCQCHVSCMYVSVTFCSAVNTGRQPAKTAGYWLIFGRLLSSHLTVNFGKKLKIRKRFNKNNWHKDAFQEF